LVFEMSNRQDIYEAITDQVIAAIERDKIPLARGYTVFNAEQCEGLPERFYVKPEPAGTPDAENDKAEQLIAASECPINYGGSRACYSPSADQISMPPRESFKSWAGFYTTVFHEMGHATGHKSRLDREFGAEFGNHTYSREELVAEFTACFLASHCDFARETFGNSVSYLKIWVSKLREQPRMLAQAAQKSQKAADRILGAAGQELAA
jgi:antirestriction protein ArdC